MNDSERDREALRVFSELCTLPPEAVPAAVVERCGGDAILRQKVERLLGADADPSDAIDDAKIDRFLDSQVGRVDPIEEAIVPEPAARSTGGQYRILRIIGEGGMGTVYEAEQVHPRRRVAIKAIRPGRISPQTRRRFEFEAQVLARLQHPGIARLYEADTRAEDGQIRAYLAMELVDGKPLDEFANARNLNTRARLRLFLKVCDAIQYAHRMGVIHRDLKPANILVTDDGEPKVLDFGVARSVDDKDPMLSTQLTLEGQMVGTLPYMSPEQVDGRQPADTRADVYSLGVVLYRLLSGKLPIDVTRDTIGRAAQRICHEEPVSLATHDRRYRGDLDVICAKALEKSVERRYQSVQSLGNEIARFLADRPIEARADSPAYVLQKVLWRYRKLVAVVAVFVMTIAGFGVYAWMLAQHNRNLAADASEARDAAMIAQQRAEEQAHNLEQTLYYSNIGYAHAAMEANDVVRAFALLESCPEPLRGWEWSYLQAQGDQSIAVRSIGASATHTVVSSADGSRRALAARGGTVRVIESASQRVIYEAKRQGPQSMALSADGRFVLFGTRPENLTLVEVETGNIRWDRSKTSTSPATAPSGPAFRAVSICPVNRSIAAVGDDGIVRVFDFESGEPRAQHSNDGKPMMCVAFTRSGDAVLTGDNDGRVRAWPIDPGEPVRTLWESITMVTALVVSDDGARVAAVTADGTAGVAHLLDPEVPTRTFEAHTANATAVAFGRDNDTLLTAGADGVIRVWSATVNRRPVLLRGHRSTTVAMFPLDDGMHFDAVGFDGSVRTFAIRPVESNAALGVGPAQTIGMAIVGESIFVGTGEGRVLEWSSRSRLLRSELPRESDGVYAVGASADGKRLAVGGISGTLRLYALPGAREILSLEKIGGTLCGVAFSPDGTTLLIGDLSGRLMRIDLATQTVTQSIETGAGIYSIHIAPDGARFVTGHAGGAVRLWEFESFAPVAERQAAPGVIFEVRYSPDGTQILAGGDTLSLLSASDLATIRTFSGHRGAVIGVAWHPDGKRIATGGADRAIRIWNPLDGTNTLTLHGHRLLAQRLAFSDDGKLLASTSDDGTLRLWPAR